MKNIYLDYAAATPVDLQVFMAMQPYFSQQFYNPSATYLAAKASRQDLEKARAGVAQNLGSKPAEIIFTAGATEANNLAIQGVMKQFPGSEVLVSAIEHESILAPAELYKAKQIPVTKQGIVDLEKLPKLITNKTVLISVMMVNNELGTVQSLREISQILNKLSILRKSKGNELPLYLHSDAAQAPLYFDLHVSRLGVDLLTINGGKIYGPKQSGALFVKAGSQLKPLILGGGQERSLRSGTENLAGIIGLAKALEIAQINKVDEAPRIKRLRDLFVGELAEKIPASIVNGSSKHHSPHILSVTFPGIDNETLMMRLDEAGIQVATGSACSASSDQPSHVLRAIGLSDDQARSTIRFSFGKDTNAQAINQTIKSLRKFTAV